MSGAIFKKEHLRSYAIVDEEGTYKVRVSNDVKKFFYERGSKSGYLVFLKAGTLENLKKAAEAVDKNGVVPFNTLSDLFFMGYIYSDKVSDPDDLPIKGEEVICNFTENEDGIRCETVTMISRRDLVLFDPDKVGDMQEAFLKLIKDEQ